MRRELSEKEILDTVRDIRHEAPGIGAYKLYLMLKELYSDQKRGRDWNKITTLIITDSLSRRGILQDSTTHFSILRVFSLKLIPILNSFRPSASKGSA